MPRYSDFEKPTVEVSRLCETTEELLRSRKFAQFLSCFNEVRHSYGLTRMVIPEEVAHSPALAERVFLFYQQEKDILKVAKKFRSRIDQLATDAFVEIRGKDIEPMILDECDTETPDWILAMAPECEKTIPIEAERELERAFQQNWLSCRRMFSDGVFEKALVSGAMNNFFTLYRHRGYKFAVPEEMLNEKIGTMEDPKYSEKMKGMTWKKFYDELDEVLLQKGLDAERLKGMCSHEANIYLAPVFIELLRRGYKVYPDLTM